jgi:hypothetical protein
MGERHLTPASAVMPMSVLMATAAPLTVGSNGTHSSHDTHNMMSTGGFSRRRSSTDAFGTGNSEKGGNKRRTLEKSGKVGLFGLFDSVADD